jgi:4-amino-4-deoxy-L-arabinose transferase-like glycosyltransferase
MKKAPRSCPLLIIVFISLVYFSFLVNRGITFYDEGYIAEASYLVYLGKIPYKEFFFQYTPLSIWLGAIWFKLFGVGILKLRWLALLISVATISTSYLITEKFLGKVGGFFASLAIMFWKFILFYPHAVFDT